MYILIIIYPRVTLYFLVSLLTHCHFWEFFVLLEIYINFFRFIYIS